MSDHFMTLRSKGLMQRCLHRVFALSKIKNCLYFFKLFALKQRKYSYLGQFEEPGSQPFIDEEPYVKLNFDNEKRLDYVELTWSIYKEHLIWPSKFASMQFLRIDSIRDISRSCQSKKSVFLNHRIKCADGRCARCAGRRLDLNKDLLI